MAPPRVPYRQADPGDLAGALTRFLEEVWTGGAAPSSRLQLGIPGQEIAARIRAATGLDVSRLQRSVQSDELRHAWRRHGAEGEAHDARPLTREDIGRIAECMDMAERVFRDGSTHQGLPVLRFEKAVPGGILVVIAEVRARRGLLTFKTMYWG